MRHLRRGAAVVTVAAGMVLACGSETPQSAPADAGRPQASAQPDRVNRAPVIQAAWLEPSSPLPGQSVQVVARATDPEGEAVRFRYAWRLNGRDLGVAGERLELTDAVKGDEVEVVVWAHDPREEGEPYTASARVANRPPRVLGVAIEGAASVEPGTDLVASPRTDDPDGDDVEVVYEWRINGEAADERGPRLSTDGLRRGDRVEVTAIARDGESESKPKTSPLVTLANSAPEIVSEVRWEQDGKSFRYQMDARDRDGDRSLRYRLRKAPPGMTIDAMLGALVWAPGEAAEGTHPVEVEVDDLHGGRTVQSFELTIRVDESDGQAPAKAER
jgi:hypothetical protein